MGGPACPRLWRELLAIHKDVGNCWAALYQGTHWPRGGIAFSTCVIFPAQEMRCFSLKIYLHLILLLLLLFICWFFFFGEVFLWVVFFFFPLISNVILQQAAFGRSSAVCPKSPGASPCCRLLPTGPPHTLHPCHLFCIPNSKRILHLW